MSSGQGREYDNETSNLNIACDPKACGSVAFFDEGPNDGGRVCMLRAVRRGPMTIAACALSFRDSGLPERCAAAECRTTIGLGFRV